MKTTAMTDDILIHFNHSHLPDHLREVSAPFRRPAESVVDTCQIVERLLQDAGGGEPACVEHVEMVVKLKQAARLILEAKDCAVRARVAMSKQRG